MKINDRRDTSESPIRLEFYPENGTEEQFCQNLIGIFQWHRGPLTAHVGDILIDGVEKVGYVLSEFPYPAAQIVESAGSDEPVVASD